jgi:hypothetical protein
VIWSDADEPDDDWEPLRTRRAGTIRLLAILVVAAMVIALVIPVVVRAVRGGTPEPEPADGVRAAVAAEALPAGYRPLPDSYIFWAL